MGEYYPIMLSLKGRTCIVIGGGAVAERKVRGLLEGGADKVVVVSPQATEKLERLAAAGSIRLERREYKEEDADGAFLLIAATDSSAVNRAAVKAGERAGALVNAADKPEEGGFVTPSVLRRGDLVIAVTTGGASPALAGMIANELGERYDDAYAGRLERLGKLRAKLVADMPEKTLRRTVLRMAAEEMRHRQEDEPHDAAMEPETIEQWMNRLLVAARGRQL